MSHTSSPRAHTFNFRYQNPENPDGTETVAVEIRYRPQENDLLLVGLPVVRWLDEQVMLDLTVAVGKRPERRAELNLLTSRHGQEIGVRVSLREMRELFAMPHRRRNRTPGPNIMARLMRLSHVLTFTVQHIRCLDYPPTLF